MRFRSLTGLALAMAALMSAPVAQGATVTYYPVPTSNGVPTGITSGPDGALWFTENVGNKIGRVTTGGNVTEYAIPTADSGPVEIAAGADGALWFTEFNANKIGRITTGPSPTVTEYPIPTAGSQPSGITAGPDGALWFTEVSGNKIGRITTGSSPTITEYPMPPGFDSMPPSTPIDITTAPDSALYFTTGDGPVVGRITTAGAITVYVAVSHSTSSLVYPNAIAYGLGYFYLPFYDGDQIARAGFPTPSYEVLFPQSKPVDVVAGPDEAMWWTLAGGTLVRLGAGGRTEHAVGGTPFGITVGPDGALWFADTSGRIGRFAIGPDPTGQPPGGGQPTAPTGSTTALPPGRASIVGPSRARATADRRGRFTLGHKVTCPAGGGSCAVTVTGSGLVNLSARTKRVVLAKGRSTLPAGRLARVRARLTGRGLRLVKKARRLKLRTVIRVVANGQATVRTVSLTLRAPKRG